MAVPAGGAGGLREGGDPEGRGRARAAHARCIVLTENAVGFESGGGGVERVPPADREADPLQVSARAGRGGSGGGAGGGPARPRPAPPRPWAWELPPGAAWGPAPPLSPFPPPPASPLQPPGQLALQPPRRAWTLGWWTTILLSYRRLSTGGGAQGLGWHLGLGAGGRGRESTRLGWGSGNSAWGRGSGAAENAPVVGDWGPRLGSGGGRPSGLRLPPPGVRDGSGAWGPGRSWSRGIAPEIGGRVCVLHEEAVHGV